MRRRGGLSFVDVLVVVALAAIAVGLVLPAVRKARRSSARTEEVNRLRKVALGAQTYQATHDQLPAGTAVPDPAPRLDPPRPWTPPPPPKGGQPPAAVRPRQPEKGTSGAAERLP